MAAPTPDELMARVHDMLPEIRGLAEETERNRNLSPQIVAKIRDAELLRICRPKEFGGFEYDGDGRARNRAGDLGGLRVDRLGGQRRALQRHLVWPFSDRGAARIMGRRGRPLQLRLLCPDRHGGSDRAAAIC